jgi:hypothetical protein
VPDVIRSTKVLIADAEHLDIAEGLRAENFSLQHMAGTDGATKGIEAFLTMGGETLDGEHRLGDLLGETLQHTASERARRATAADAASGA